MSRIRTILISVVVVVAVAVFLLWRFNLLTLLNPSSSQVQNVTPTPTANISVTLDDTGVPGGKDPWGMTFDSKGHLWIALPGCDPNPRCRVGDPPGKLAEYNPTTAQWVATYALPSNFGQALFLAFDKQGKLWFPMFATNSIGMFNPADKTFRQWTVPTPKSGPWDLVIDHHGYIWFTEHYLNKIARFDPTNQTFEEIETPILKSQPYGITVDASNNIWFTENNKTVAQIGEYTAQGQLKEYKIPYATSGQVTPHLIIVGHHGDVWWSEGSAGRIGHLDVAAAKPGTTNGVTEYVYTHTCITCGTHTSGIAIDSSGAIWFDDSLQSIVGSFSPATSGGQGTFTIYNTPTSFSHPHDGLLVDTQNRIWFAEEYVNRLGMVTQTLIS
jgi:streptogramin lyase